MLWPVHPVERHRGLLAPALAIVFAAAAATASCIEAPPADPPQVPQQGPTIVQDAVTPSANVYLRGLPAGGEFSVPVKISDASQTMTCAVFIDFDPGRDNSQFATNAATRCPNTPPALDGLTTLTFTLTPISLGDPTACHVIQCFVTNAFDLNSLHTPSDALATDSVTWQYAPEGPGGCSQLPDAGDGSFPPDAPTDTGILLTSGAVGSSP
jgi:hypothetical protein